MDKQLNLKNVAIIGRTFEEYSKMFGLHDTILQNEIILDVASGVSSFCAETNRQGFDVTASDRIYSLSPYEIEQNCVQDLDMIIKQLPDIADLFVWDFFKDIQALENNRKKAYRLFIEDFRVHRTKRYIPVEYPFTDFHDNQFTISLVYHFLFLYEDKLDYDFHKKTILELLRITSKEIRIFPIMNIKGKKSQFVEPLIHDKDFENLQMFIKKVDYEFIKNGNEMIIIKK